MMIKRKSTWQSDFGRAFWERADTPWRWGRHDCCIAVCNLVREFTGTDLAKGFRGYIGKEGAVALLDERGGVEGIAERVAQEFSIPEIAPKFAQRGDIVLAAGVSAEGDVTGSKSLGIIDLSGCKALVAARPMGWRALPKVQLLRAWRI